MANFFASELSYQVLEKRRRESELTTPLLHERFGVTHLIVQQPVTREATAADRPVGVSREAWDALRINRRNER